MKLTGRKSVIRIAIREAAEYDIFVLTGLLLGAIAFKLEYLVEVFELALQPRSLTYTEGINALLATRPELWYQPFATAPHLPTIYPLGYHVLVGGVTNLTPLSVFQTMHLVGLLSGLAGGAVLVAILHDHDVRLELVLAGGALYALSPIVTGATVLGRVDHLGVLLGLLALFVATRHGRGGPWAASALCIGAMYVKQSLFVFPATIVLWYWLRSDRRDAVAFAGTTALVGLGGLAALVVATDGRAWAHLVELNAAQPWLPDYAAGLSGWFAFTHLGLVVAAGVALYRRVDSLSAFRRWDVLFLVIAVLSALAMAGKPGAWSGYFLPVIAAGALVSMRWLEDIWPGRGWDSTVGLVVLFVLVAQFGAYAAWQTQPEYDRVAQQAVLADLEAVDGPILTVDNGLLVQTGTDEPYESQLIRTLDAEARPEGIWLTERIRDEEFGAIVIRVDPADPPEGSRWSPAQLEAIRDSYRLSARHGSYRVFLPIE